MSPWRKPTSNATTRIATFGRSTSFYEPFTLANHLTTTNRATKNRLVKHQKDVRRSSHPGKERLPHHS
jgi:hypothetical protein